MKIYCISDNLEVSLGLKLSGAETCVLTEKDKVNEKIDDIQNNPDIGILIVTENIYQLGKEKLDEIRDSKRTPLVVKI